MLNKKNDQVVNPPLLTSLVAAGDPRMKKQVAYRESQAPHLNTLNQHINDIENAIGQKDSNPIGRAFAIRKEKMRKEIKT